MSLDWIELGEQGGFNDVLVAFALGYMLRVSSTDSGKRYKIEFVSVGGTTIFGNTDSRESAKEMARKRLRVMAVEYINYN